MNAATVGRQASKWAAPSRSGKIQEGAELVTGLASARASGGLVALSQGCFDLVHLGHLRHFKEAKAMAGILVVAVSADEFVSSKGPDRPLFSLAERMEFIAELECVDHVVPSRVPTAVELLRLLEPDIYIRGAEYRDTHFDDPRFVAERAVIAAYGGAVRFSGDPLVRSSTHLQQQWSPQGGRA
ncbi:adenylyltransferase/cytidyltransferase family protein [Amycolatopsis tolypomycina]|uniref:RfaE bifunctional protein, domain II n=1 Tax=Amycolatopsis tolypomycina TaxID=208445 RepID=A0A1H4YVR8_9PSEU|nr:adenylyltransferase/cytidyltransferase family protein [Amycolatopsis tolypomycina]SED21735.1 rfaE bifunctional protein, domain II [Amycolatopsis tolypomycina]